MGKFRFFFIFYPTWALFYIIRFLEPSYALIFVAANIKYFSSFITIILLLAKCMRLSWWQDVHNRPNWFGVYLEHFEILRYFGRFFANSCDAVLLGIWNSHAYYFSKTLTLSFAFLNNISNISRLFVLHIPLFGRLKHGIPSSLSTITR